MDCTLLETIKASFNQLWSCKKRGETLEIEVPYVSTRNKFISLFITDRNGRFIVSDGGYIQEILDESAKQGREEKDRQQILKYYSESFSVKATKKIDGTSFFFKNVEDVKFLSAAVFEMAQFVSETVSTLGIEFSPVKEDAEERFRKQAKKYIIESFGAERVAFQKPLSFSTKKVSVSAQVLDKTSRVNVIQYVSGSSESYFQLSTSKAAVIFEILNSLNWDKLNRKIALVDDQASGYNPGDQMQNDMGAILKKHADGVVNWSDSRDKFKELIPV